MTNYKCLYCTKCLSTKSNLNRHKLTCTKKDQYILSQEILKDKEKQEKDKELQEKEKKLEKKIHQLELEIAAKDATIKTLEKQRPNVINNNSYTNNVTDQSVNIKLSLKEISQDYLDDIVKNITENHIADGPSELYKFLNNTTDLKNRYYMSNKQHKVIAYKKPDTQKIIKDTNGTMLTTDLINSIPLDKYNVEEIEYKRPINPKSKKLLTGKPDEFIQHFQELICDGAQSEYKLKNSLTNENKSFKNFKKVINKGIIIYLIYLRTSREDYSLRYGINSVVYSLMNQNIVNVIDDMSNVINDDFDTFLMLFYEIMLFTELIFHDLFKEEIKYATEDNKELSQQSYESFQKYLIDPTEKNKELKYMLLSK